MALSSSEIRILTTGTEVRLPSSHDESPEAPQAAAVIRFRLATSGTRTRGYVIFRLGPRLTWSVRIF
jgi:hypothetical protein